MGMRHTGTASSVTGDKGQRQKQVAKHTRELCDAGGANSSVTGDKGQRHAHTLRCAGPNKGDHAYTHWVLRAHE